MTNARDLAIAAVSKWRQFNGNKTLYLLCQRFDGWYMQWAYEGFSGAAENSIHVYPSAAAAARASSIFTRNVNDGSVQPGDLIYWNWGQYGHVASVIGRDGGRTLVTHTSNSGDNLESFGNNVHISHADTISLDVYGVSHTNGQNRPRTGLSGYNIAGGGGSSAPAPSGSSAQIDLRDGWAWYNSAGEAEQERNPHGPKWTGQLLAKGVYGVIQAPNAIQIRAHDGSAPWISPKARGRISGSVAAAPSGGQKINLTAGWAWYTSANEAIQERNPHGPKWTREKLLSGHYTVTARGAGGAIQVRANDGSHVWVSPKASNKIY